jgi:hypothetical protein
VAVLDSAIRARASIVRSWGVFRRKSFTLKSLALVPELRTRRLRPGWLIVEALCWVSPVGSTPPGAALSASCAEGRLRPCWWRIGRGCPRLSRRGWAAGASGVHRAAPTCSVPVGGKLCKIRPFGSWHEDAFASPTPPESTYRRSLRVSRSWFQALRSCIAHSTRAMVSSLISAVNGRPQGGAMRINSST